MTQDEYIVAIEEIRPQLMKAAAAFVSDYDTEDIVQETVKYCHEKLATFDAEKSQFASWVIRKLRHIAIDAIRADERRQRSEGAPIEFDDTLEAQPIHGEWYAYREEEWYDTGFNVIDPATAIYPRRAQPKPRLGQIEPSLTPYVEDSIVLKDALAKLTDKQREVVLAVIVEEYSLEEYAEKTGRTKANVRYLLDAGLASMRRYLGVELESVTLAA